MARGEFENLLLARLTDQADATDAVALEIKALRKTLEGILGRLEGSEMGPVDFPVGSLPKGDFVEMINQGGYFSIDPDKPFGPQIREKREKLRLTITQLAQMSNMTRQAVSNIENGHSGGNPRTRAAIVEALKKAADPRWGISAWR